MLASVFGVGSGEFVKAMRMLTTPRTREATQTSDYELLFDSFDGDASGTIEYGELNKLLRRGLDVRPATSWREPSALQRNRVAPALALTLTPNP